MLNLIKGRWTPVTILVLWIVVGVLRQLNLIGATVGNAVTLLLIAIGLAWAFAETGWLRRLSEFYLWLVFIVSMGELKGISQRLAEASDVENQLAFYIAMSLLHVLDIAAALWTLGAWKERDHAGARPYFARLAGGLFIVSAAVVWVGAVSWPGERLEKVAAHLADHQWTNGCFAVGALIMLAGVTVLTLSLRDAGDRLFCEFGFVGFLVASVFWLIYLGFRLTVTEWAAKEMEQTGIRPASYEMLRTWAGSFFGIYLVLAYLAIAGYGAALLKTGLSPRWLGRTCVVWGIAAALMNLLRVPGFDLPLEVPIMPYLVGMFLLKCGEEVRLTPGAVEV